MVGFQAVALPVRAPAPPFHTPCPVAKMTRTDTAVEGLDITVFTRELLHKMKNTLKKYFVFEGKVFGAGHLYIIRIFDFSSTWPVHIFSMCG